MSINFLKAGVTNGESVEDFPKDELATITTVEAGAPNVSFHLLIVSPRAAFPVEHPTSLGLYGLIFTNACSHSTPSAHVPICTRVPG